MKSCICGSRAPFTCGWKHRSVFMIPARLVVPGDKIQRGVAYVPVRDVRILSANPKAAVVISTDYGDVTADPEAACLVIRVGVCQAPCCEHCAREVAEGRHVCRAHWSAWELSDVVDQREEAYCG